MRLGHGLAKRALTALALAALALLYGCGGGGGDAPGGFGSGVSIFITDDLSSQFDQVWVRVFRIDVVGEGGTTTVFESTEGTVIDVASLNDGASRFAYFGTGAVPDSPTGVSIVLDKTVSLVLRGGPVARTVEFDAALTNANDRTQIDLAISLRVGQDSIVLDFDLSKWTIVGDTVHPVVVIGSDAGLGLLDRHEERTFYGMVAELSGEAPDQTFSLRTPEGRTLPVTTNQETVIFGPDGSRAELANGQKVAVSGRFSTDLHSLVAGQVQIFGPHRDAHRIVGRAFDPNVESCTFLVELKEVHGFIPNHRIVTVLTQEGTLFLSASGEEVTKERFYERLGSHDTLIVADGIYDPGTNTFEARVVKHHHRHHDRREVKAVGEVTAVMADRRAFAMALIEWAGFDAHVGDEVRVATGADTEFFRPDGTPIRASVFFSRLTPGAVVAVHGHYSDGVIRADTVRVRHWAPDGHPARATGSAIEWSSHEGAVWISLIEWSGFDAATGDRLKVQTGDRTRFFTLGDHEITKAQFFLHLAVHSVVHAEGRYIDGVLHAATCKLLE